MKKVLVLDRLDYKNKEDEFLKIVHAKSDDDFSFVYTTYEDELIRKVRNIRIVGSLLQHFLYWMKSFYYTISILKSDADEIYCLNPIVSIFLGVFNKKRKIVMGGFLFEKKKNKVYYWLRKVFTKLSLKGISSVAVYGSHEVNYYESIFQCNKFVYVPYGIDYDNDSVYGGNLPEKFFFSGGGSNRDYKTLTEAYNKMKRNRYPLVIATQSWRLSDCEVSEISVLADVVVENFGDVLKHSSLLVLSLKQTDISVGHMVMFQAMSLGVPLLVNDIPAIRDYVDDQMVTFYQSGNIDDLRVKLETFAENKSEYMLKSNVAKRKYHKELCLEAFIKRFLNL